MKQDEQLSKKQADQAKPITAKDEVVEVIIPSNRFKDSLAGNMQTLEAKICSLLRARNFVGHGKFKRFANSSLKKRSRKMTYYGLDDLAPLGLSILNASQDLQVNQKE